MRVLVQWARAAAGDWQAVPGARWSALPARVIPGALAVVDSQPGWIEAICIQGTVYQADHYAVEALPDGALRVWAWNDDPDDWAQAGRWGRIVEHRPAAPDPTMGGAVHPRVTQQVFAEGDSARALSRAHAVRPWASFRPPPVALHRHGIWLPDALHEAHQARRRPVGWREWIEGVDRSHLRQGRIAPSRSRGLYIVPDGTRTYYHSSTALALPPYGAQFENALQLAPAGGPTPQQATGINQNGDVCWAAASPANEPDSAAWPTGTYRYQLDVSNVGADLTFGCLTLGANDGGFGRLDAALSAELERHAQAEPSFVNAGLHLATYTGTWSPGAQTDRFAVVVAAERTAGHGNQTITMDLDEADDFADGPWPAAPVAAAEDAIWHGTNA